MSNRCFLSHASGSVSGMIWSEKFRTVTVFEITLASAPRVSSSKDTRPLAPLSHANSLGVAHGGLCAPRRTSPGFSVPRYAARRIRKLRALGQGQQRRLRRLPGGVLEPRDRHIGGSTASAGRAPVCVPRQESRFDLTFKRSSASRGAGAFRFRPALSPRPNLARGAQGSP